MNHQHALISINGCIASGKSTIAKQLARWLRARAHTAAVLDLDLIYEMLGDDPKHDEKVWRSARQAASSLAAALMTAGVEFIIVDGELLSRGARADLTHAFAAAVPVHYITLNVSYAAALRRAEADPTRGLSKDPLFLQKHCARFDQVLNDLRATDLILDTEMLSPQQVIDRIAAVVIGDEPSTDT